MGLPVLAPMLATRWERVTEEAGWAHEVKWDGVRAIVSGDGAIRSRNGNRIDGGYPELSSATPPDTVVDGEIVAFDSGGQPSFQLLQGRMHVRNPPSSLVEGTPVTLMVFDLLHAGRPLIDLPWEERRSILRDIPLGRSAVLVDAHDDGAALFAAVGEHGLEGIVSKRRSSVYRPGRRSEDWRKVVHRHTCEAVVVGSIGGSGGRAGTFGSLALGLWTAAGRLRYVGAVGSGFDHETLRVIDAALEQMETIEPPPLEDASLVPRPVRWVLPTLVAVVEYASWTSDGRLRAPVFKGFAATPAEEVSWEDQGPVPLS